MSALDATAAALLLVAGVYLFDPALFDKDIYAEAGRFALPGGFFIYASLVLLLAGVAGFREETGFFRRFFFGSAALSGIGAIMIVLGVEAAFFAEPARILVGLLIAPGALALLSSAFGDAAKVRRESAEPETLPQTDRDSGKTVTFDVVRSYAWQGVLAAILNVLVVLYLGFGFFLYYLLRLSLIEDIDLDLARLVTIALPDMAGRILPIGLALAIAMLLVMPLIGLVIAFSASLSKRARPDIDRDLSAEEISFVTSCVTQLAAYIDENGYRERARRIARMTLTTFLVAVALVVGAMFVLDEAALLFAAAPEGADWSYISADTSFAIPFVVVGVISWAFAPSALVSLLNRKRGEAGALLMLDLGRGLAEIQALIVKQVRARRVSLREPFEPATFLWRTAVATSLATLGWVAIVTAVAGVYWQHDRATDTIYTARRIETGDFWTMERTVHAYSQVQAVQLECSLDNDGDTRSGVTLVLPGGIRRAFVRETDLDTSLDALVRIDDALRAAGVPFVFALPDEASAAYVVERDCVLKLAQGMSDTDGAKLEQVFHMDTWHERRWRQRIGEPMVSLR